MTVKAIYENGVFRPVEPVDLEEKAEVNLEIRLPLFAPNDPDHGRVREVMEGCAPSTNAATTTSATRSGLKAPSPTSRGSSPWGSGRLPTKSTSFSSASSSRARLNPWPTRTARPSSSTRFRA